MNYYLNIIKKNKTYLAISSLLDLLFVMVFGFFYNILALEILFIIANMQDVASNITSKTLFTALISLNEYKWNLLLMTVLLLLSFYLSWSLLMGLNWRYLLRVKLSYMKRFFLLNAFWLGLIVLVIVLFSAITFVLPELFQMIVLAFAGIILLSIMLVIPFSYVTVRKKASIRDILKKGIKKIPISFLINTVMIFFLVLIDQIMKFLPSISFFLGLILVFPLFALYRLTILEFSR